MHRSAAARAARQHVADVADEQRTHLGLKPSDRGCRASTPIRSVTQLISAAEPSTAVANNAKLVARNSRTKSGVWVGPAAFQNRNRDGDGFEFRVTKQRVIGGKSSMSVPQTASTARDGRIEPVQREAARLLEQRRCVRRADEMREAPACRWRSRMRPVAPRGNRFAERAEVRSVSNGCGQEIGILAQSALRCLRRVQTASAFMSIRLQTRQEAQHPQTAGLPI